MSTKSLYFVQVRVRKAGVSRWAYLGEDFRPAKTWSRAAMFPSRQSALLGLLDWLRNGWPGAQATVDYRVMHSVGNDATAATEKKFFGLVGAAYVAPAQWAKGSPITKRAFVSWLVKEEAGRVGA